MVWLVLTAQLAKHVEGTRLVHGWECEVVLKPAPVPPENTPRCIGCLRTPPAMSQASVQPIAQPWLAHAPGRFVCDRCRYNLQEGNLDALREQHRAMFDVIDSCKTAGTVSGDNAELWVVCDAFPPARRRERPPQAACLICASILEVGSPRRAYIPFWTQETGTYICLACKTWHSGESKVIGQVKKQLLPVGSTALEYIQ